jgi:hypothetical protein
LLVTLVSGDQRTELIASHAIHPLGNFTRHRFVVIGPGDIVNGLVDHLQLPGMPMLTRTAISVQIAANPL